MFKIGDFSRLSFVTVKTLHYYDEIGLLKPVKVDRFTGYRYYSAEQLTRLNYIVSFKNLGLSLEEIATLLNDSLTPQQMRHFFIIKRAELQRRVSEEHWRLEQVEKLLKQIEKEGKMPEYQVIIKQLSSMKVAYVRGTVPIYSDIKILWDRICPVFEKYMSVISGPPLAIYHDMEYREKDVDIEVAIPITATPPIAEPIKVRELPAEATVASMIYRGPYENIHEAYQAMMAWCETNGYELSGPDREVYLTGPNDVQNSADYVTELQQPIRKV